MARDGILRLAHGERHEVLALIRWIQALTLEVHELGQHAEASPELQAKEQTREQLRRRLAVVARQAAAKDLSGKAR
jgi:hypothetical protein